MTEDNRESVRKIVWYSKITYFLPQTLGHITQWLAELSRMQEATETAKIALGLLFASAFQVPMVSDNADRSVKTGG